MNEQVPDNKPKRDRCHIYIDGFNWYYGIFVHKPGWKWLNQQALFEELRKDEDVNLIHFFTALVEPDSPYNEARNRQKRYIKALESFAKMRVTLGYFQEGKTKCRARCGEEYPTIEEKKTDVNIAVSIISDAVGGLVDSIVLVSGDADLQPAVEWIVKNYPKIKVTVYVPSIEHQESERRSDFYRRIWVQCKFLPIDKMFKHQLPAKFITRDGKTIERPETWKE
ncbi:MAG TPA: NYN domain-containing protein [Candidatus Acidoferrum sp.]|jgi:uncharacterized LabA/DUF88 family protein|nr:NYN domain-containing protein [Candidatus Acidoferrum sp.]